MRSLYKYIIVGCALVASLSGCIKDEDPINAELSGPFRKYDVNSSDPIFKYVSQYYAKFGKEFIVDVDTSDYLYNFVSKNQAKMTALSSIAADKQAAIDFVKDIFLNRYSDDVIKKIFPNSIIVAENIIDLAPMSKPSVDFYSAPGLYAIALNGKTLAKMTDAERATFRNMINSKFIELALVAYNKISMDKFYKFSTKLYGVKVTADAGPTAEQTYNNGFLKIPSYFWGSYTWASKSDDQQMWIGFLFSPPENAEELLKTYPILKAKHDALIAALAEAGIDYKKITL